MSEREEALVDLEADIALGLERWRLVVARQCIHDVWLQSAKAGRASVDMEDSLEEGSVKWMVQRKESEIHGIYTKYLQAHMDSLNGRLRDLK